MGMPDEVCVDKEGYEYSTSTELGEQHERDVDLLLFARTLVSLGEFERCAHLVHSKKGEHLFASETQATPIVQEIRFLRSYSLYMVITLLMYCV